MNIRNFPRLFIPVFALICRLTLAIIFLYAGMGKIINPDSFAVAIYNYRLLPDYAINFVAVFLPWLEIIIALCLICGINIKGASSLSSLLFLIFAVALTINLVRGLDISCGCFGSSSGNINWFYLIRDLSLCCMSVFVFVYDRGCSYFLA